MARALDFNSLVKPTLELTMKDDARTVLRVTTPKEALIERLAAGLPELEEALAKKDAGTIRAGFELAAELMSNNTDLLPVTAEELRDKYKLSLEDLVVFFSVYLDFVGEIKNAKN